MTSGATGRPDGPDRYEIRIQGRIGPRWSAWLDGVDVTPDADGTTVLACPVVDQSALHGLLARLRDIGLPLISVVRVEPDSGQARTHLDNDNPTGD